MYNATTSEALTSYADSKYTVADILSSMANGDPAPTYSEPSTTGIGYTSKVGSVTTPTLTLTPTTLASLEQTFIELQSVPPVTTAAQDLSRQSGFVPPVVDPIMTKNEPMDYYDTSSTDSDWMPTPAKQARAGDNTPSVISFAGSPAVSSTTGTARRQGGRRRRDDKVSPEEEERRRVRRERNKVAAAKCRQRRVDQTNTLISETETLEEEKANLENEIQTLQQQKEQLEFLLEAHKPMCTKNHITKVKVKVERELDNHCNVAVTSAHNIMNGILPVITTSAQEVITSRPSSLALPTRTVNITEATGVVISTPSNGVFATLGLDSMVDGHTGLTPITGGPSCGSEAHRNSSDSSSPSDTLASPTTLMAL